MIGVGVVAAGVLACVLGVVVLRARFMVVRVTGPSMQPTLSHGDRVLVRRCAVGSVRSGDVVLIRGPRMPGAGLTPAEFMRGATNETRPLMIKRVAAGPGERVPGGSAVVGPAQIIVTGDNETMSFDSRQLGPFDAREVRGVVVRRFARG